MSEIKLNLARKWRSRTFDEVVGQDLPIRMLKNSLYLDHYFPVYLFSGQRGCGKTTAARIFAGAVNCHKLADFQKNPKEIIPCLACKSCLAMKEGNHPDFIEIDAASHTGVDNVRQIIDAAAFMPLLGRKKIYLIDEAHMLSKAAFNAFLKILEEPPASVFFILATTDPHKIIETVKSRCFQVFFRALESQALVKHLAYVCQHEEIPYEPEALELLVKQTEGSVRDALNLLEQVRFTARRVDKHAVLTVLGHLDEERLFTIFDKVLNSQPAALLVYLQEICFESFSAPILWRACIDFVRTALWYTYEVTVQVSEQFKEIVANHNVETLRSCLQLLYTNEPLFLKTRNQHQVLEYVLLQMCTSKNGSSKITIRENVPKKNTSPQTAALLSIPTQGTLPESTSHEWQTFLQKISALDDPLVFSIFKQGEFKSFQDGVIIVSFPQNNSFFGDLLENTKNVWNPKLIEVFGDLAKLNSIFDGQAKQITPTSQHVGKVVHFKPNFEQKSPPVTQKENLERKQVVSSRPPVQKSFEKKLVKKIQESPIDVSDEATWKKAHIILKAFPGTIVEIPKDEHA
jgi:DNA polymerase-3 subunit gamma/tau